MISLEGELDRLRQKYKNDAQGMNTAMMALYKENKVNPAGGCVPLVIQMPMFIALWQSLQTTFELRHAPFLWGFTWIKDLSQPDKLIAFAPMHINLVLFSFTFDPTAGESRRFGPGLLWLAFLFASSLMLQPCFLREMNNDTLSALRLSVRDPFSIFLAKLSANTLFLLL